VADPLDLVSVAGGTRLRLRVHPKARKDAITGVFAGALKVSVTAPPEKGKANDAVVKLLSKALELPKRSIEIVSGETSQDKTVVVALEAGELRRRLELCGHVDVG
jgi:uncharacterized protein (TIGR00251 family)